MNTRSSFWKSANVVYVFLLASSGVAWLIQGHTFAVSVGLVAVVFAFFIYKQQRWAYFAAAVWCFGLLRIAMDDGYDFYQGYQSWVKLPCVAGIVVAIILHEKVAKPTTKSAAYPK